MRSLVPLSVCPGPGARPRKGTVRVIETGRAGSPNLRFWDQLLLGKISESDYSERTLGPKYIAVYEDAIGNTSTKWAPWYVIPANHKWFRDHAISENIADTMADMGLQLPASHVDLAETRRKYHAAEPESRGGESSAAGRNQSG